MGVTDREIVSKGSSSACFRSRMWRWATRRCQVYRMRSKWVFSTTQTSSLLPTAQRWSTCFSCSPTPHWWSVSLPISTRCGSETSLWSLAFSTSQCLLLLPRKTWGKYGRRQKRRIKEGIFLGSEDSMQTISWTRHASALSLIYETLLSIQDGGALCFKYQTSGLLCFTDCLFLL